MNSNTLKAYLQLSRPVNVLITFFSIPLACWIAGGSAVGWMNVLLAALTGALVTIGANAINDSFDIEIDRINRPDRPLPRGALTQRAAQWMWRITSLLAIGMNVFLTSLAFVIVVLAVVLLYYYSARLKRTVVAGNLVVGLMTGMAFIYGGVVVGNVERAIMPALFAFLANLSRELIKDIEDVEGDRQQHAATLPVRYGVAPTVVLATISVLFLISSTLLAVHFSIYKISFLYIVSFADIVLILSIIMMWYDFSPRHMRRVSMMLKISMVVGLTAILVGSI
jgi:geranylgeranylglycerol-phosphate geranylgeranyltransferase